MPTIFNGIKIAIQKCEQKKFLNTLMHINTHIVAEERNKNNTNGKITMMINKREREKKMHLHIHFFKKSRRCCCTRKKNGLIVLVEIGVFVLGRKKMG